MDGSAAPTGAARAIRGAKGMTGSDPRPALEPPPNEVEMGLRVYGTRTPGIGGRLKTSPEDFRVDEISRFPCPTPDGRFTIAQIESWDVEQNTLVARLQRSLQLPPGAIGYAGTKDRRAVTTQLLSLPVAPERLDGLRLSGVRVLDRYRAAEGLALGHLYGNRFQIRLEGLEGGPEELVRRAHGIEGELRAAGGFANFFGPQRFGEVRPVTHLVGRSLVKGSASEAVEAYLTAGVGEEVPEGHEARLAYAAHHDPVRALREFPSNFSFERALLTKLSEGKGGEQALRALPRTLRTLFVHAYQSYLYNRVLSSRLEQGLSLREPLVGDQLVRLGADGLDTGKATVAVSADNLEEAQAWVASGRARVGGALVGTDTPVQEGEPGRLVEEVLAAEEVERKDFHIPEAPELSSRGTFRALLAPVPLKVFPPGGPRVERGSNPEGTSSIAFDFVLEKGQYATVLLREFTKARGGGWKGASPSASRPPSS